jgi:hypothetical protein
MGRVRAKAASGLLEMTGNVAWLGIKKPSGMLFPLLRKAAGKTII